MAAKIFIVEDEQLAVKNMSKILKEEGFEIVGTANDCLKASEMINSLHVDLVVCNLYLKFTFSGKNIIKLIREVKKVPFVFLSSFTHDERLNKILRTKSEIYLCSPYTREQLISSVKKLLRNVNQNQNTRILPMIAI